MNQETTLRVGTLLFDQFELLDVFGPLEMLGMYPERFALTMIAEDNQPVASDQGPTVMPDLTLQECSDLDVLLIPGGAGTRREVNNKAVLGWLCNASKNASLVTTVCTGSALLAASGALDGCRATTNKNAFEWVSGFGKDVTWVPEARWVNDGKFYTSSGVSAGMDMALAVISDLMGKDAAIKAADWAEYHWNSDPLVDPFAAKAGLV